MRIQFLHNEPTTVPWEPGEIVVIQIVERAADGTYTCDTLDTFPADIKERHAAQLAQANGEHAETVRQLLLEREVHAAEITALQRQQQPPEVVEVN